MSADLIFAGLSRPAAPPSILPQAQEAPLSMTRRVMEGWLELERRRGHIREGKVLEGLPLRAEADGASYRFQCQIQRGSTQTAQFGFAIPTLKEDLERGSSIVVFQCRQTREELGRAQTGGGPLTAEFQYQLYPLSQWLAWGTGSAQGSVEHRIRQGDSGRYVVTVAGWADQTIPLEVTVL